MNTSSIKILVLLQFLFLFSMGSVLFTQKKLAVELEVNFPVNVKDFLIELPIKKLGLTIGNYRVKTDDDVFSPLEIITDIYDNQYAIFIVPDLGLSKKKSYTIEQGEFSLYPKRTSAELTHKIGGQFIGKEYIGGYSWVKTDRMTLPGTFTDHSYYIKYEGPGWESDKAAFRFYLDNRNAIDVFAKTTPNLVLAGVGTDGFENYHKLAPWGMDNLKVGKSLGLGSIAYWDGKKAVRVEKKDSTTCMITADGKLRSQVKTIYHGWKTDGKKRNMTSLISIDAGSRSSHIELLIDSAIDNISTGIIKQNGAKLLIRNNLDEEWSYIATFGKQSLNKDIQGLVVFARTKQIKQITEDELNHVIVLQPDGQGYVDYYIMPTWELDEEPVRTEEEFLSCIEEQLLRLSNSIKYHISNSK